MLKIRLSRVGKKGYAQYRIIVAEKTAPIKGKFVEQIGSYNPHTKDILVKEGRVEHWISQGATCSDTVYNLLVENNIIKGDKKFLTLKKKKGEEEKLEKEEVDKKKIDSESDKDKDKDEDKDKDKDSDSDKDEKKDESSNKA